MADELSPKTVDALLSLAEELRDLGVSEFSYGELRVKFRDDVVTLKAQPVTVTADPPAPKVPLRSIYDAPSLFPEGRPEFRPTPKVDL